MGENATMYLLLSIVAFDLYEGSILKATYERNKYEYLCQKPTQAYVISGRKCYLSTYCCIWMNEVLYYTHNTYHSFLVFGNNFKSHLQSKVTQD